ncbi:MAG: pyridoxal-phosphate dependent enzyme [Armatimonadota bacterium]
MATAFIPAPLRRLTGGESRVDVPAASVADLLDGLERRYPGVRGYVVDDHGAVRAFVNIFVNAAEIRSLAGLQTPLQDRDEVSIIPAMAGGATAGGRKTISRGGRPARGRPARSTAPRQQPGETILDSILDAIGSTPLVRLHRVARTVRAEVLVKLEFLNPGGSVKDRIGIAMIADAERRGTLRPGGTIVEATSGNTGVGIAIAAAVRGYQTVFVMPDKMSEEKIRLLRAFGARVVITPTAVAPEDPRSYYSVSRRIAEETAAYYAGQYHNPINPQVHYETTGPELWRQTGGKLDVLVAGMGTGGTISGAGRYLKERHPGVIVIGADPVGSVYTEYVRTRVLPEAHTYKIEGIGEDFLPSTMDFSVVDQVIPVTDREAFVMTRRLVREEGLFCGGSSGAAVAAALKYLRARADLGQGLRVVVILPDDGARYLSKVFSDDWMREHGFLERDAGSVADLLAAKGALATKGDEVITAAMTDSVREVVTRMKSFDISQLPVVDGGRLAGLVSEVALLTYLLDGDHGADDPIAPLVEPAPPVVTPDTPVGELADLFGTANAVVVVSQGAVVGIVTKIDLIDHLARRMG